MKISTILDYIDSGHMALPEFQRGYMWNRDQMRGLFGSPYFLDARRELLAAETNRRLAELLHGDLQWLAGAAKPAASASVVVITRGFAGDAAEEEELEALNEWMEAQGLPRGVLAFDFADEVSGEQKAVFDLAWPHGIQEALSQPVAVLLNENTETLALANRAGFQCFTTTKDFKGYMHIEILAN